MKKATFYFDGACLPVNPGGTGTFGIVGVSNNQIICEKSGIVSETSTNNIAEWTAFIEALKEAQKLNITHLTVKGDSQLVVNQINNIWRVRDGNIVKLHRQAKELLKYFQEVNVIWIRRKGNLADRPAHLAYINYIEQKPKQRAQKENYRIIRLSPGAYRVITDKEKTYIVRPDEPSCTCPFFQRVNSYKLHIRSGIVIRCKHIFAVQAYAKK